MDKATTIFFLDLSKKNPEYKDCYEYKRTILTLDGKKVKRTIQHIGQGFDGHVTINGIQYDVKNVEYDVETGYGTWKCVDSKKLGRYPNI